MTRIESILVASDLSEASDEVVRVAAEIAAAKNAELHFVHAFDFPSEAARPGAGSPPGSFPDRIAQAESVLDRQIERVVPAGTRVASRRVDIYVAHRAIADAAAGVGADLIVVGGHSHRRMGDELLGSTADRVIRAAAVPCLVVRAPLRLPLRTVVAPVDLSPGALGALEVAMTWGAGLGEAADGGRGQPTSLVVLHILPRTMDIPEFALDPAEIELALHREVQEAQGRVGGAALDVREEVRWGDSAVDDIIQYLKDGAADLVVIGTHGQGLVKRFLIGSVASGVARRAPCPVLLVPPAMWKDEGRSQG